MSLWVVVPAYDEEASIGGTLAALAAQHDTGFRLVVVDNASTDGTARIVREFARSAPFPVELVHEAEPGAGTAADTGFRHAVRGGARLLLRTDADCLPARNWTAVARAEFGRGAEVLCGRSVPRRDERPTFAEARLLPALVRLSALYGRGRPAHRDPRYLAPYVLCHGHNLGITAELYVRCGGAPRERLEDGSEDVTLLNRAREHSARVVRAEHLVVQSSLRRLRSWGARRTLLWYWDRRYRPADTKEVHVR
ncbi:glycosyltransferase family 2 protein [Streptomyces lavendulae]|uniref:glycosyltransferase family 2 protein n=1 Tax=Streptomyces lavendulae TaxID=1914 RepID=UPI0024A1B813|nr:glycosyltransferase family 2 protein [Streptomyces lavendulae]GLX21220.1 glycosyl transferase [Streptomyces lavendulae subsp. lavendulae]GLX27739.1 glycosyl transferase [Streptomyces lavendulae subsp. lavendulae]